jgi:hypothetical protein
MNEIVVATIGGLATVLVAWMSIKKPAKRHRSQLHCQIMKLETSDQIRLRERARRRNIWE